MMAISRDQLCKEVLGYVKEYQKEEGVSDLQLKMDVIAALNPQLFRGLFGNDPEKWARLREEAGRITPEEFAQQCEELPQEVKDWKARFWG